MTVMSGRQNSATLRYQRIRSLLCLFALLLLQLPAISAAVMAATGACCSSDNCPIALHHHPAPAQAAPAKAQESAMDCGHEMNPGTGKMSSCSMSCCKTVEQSAIHGHFFVLSPMVARADSLPVSESLSAVAVSEPPGFFALFSPPPESF